MNRISSLILKGLLFVLGGIVLLLCVSALPYLAKEAASEFPEVAYLHYPILLGLYATAIPFFYAIYETVAMLGIIEKESIASKQLVPGFKRIQYCGILIVLLYCAGIVLLSVAKALIPMLLLIGIGVLLITAIVISTSAFMKQAIGKSSLA
ncbi:DUF2975 domain-containing protein [Solibacillus sp. FSL H8-0523]|uniref:DUF2975 domain-containing protein n=1 Tax=Solibacillus sp. FSL H8-0523 TaxID=2954511 RepID=UPI003100F576